MARQCLPRDDPYLARLDVGVRNRFEYVVDSERLVDTLVLQPGSVGTDPVGSSTKETLVEQPLAVVARNKHRVDSVVGLDGKDPDWPAIELEQIVADKDRTALDSTSSVEQQLVVDIHQSSVLLDWNEPLPVPQLVAVPVAASSTVVERFVVVSVRLAAVVESVVDGSTADIVLERKIFLSLKSSRSLFPTGCQLTVVLLQWILLLLRRGLRLWVSRVALLSLMRTTRHRSDRNLLSLWGERKKERMQMSLVGREVLFASRGQARKTTSNSIRNESICHRKDVSSSNRPERYLNMCFSST